MPHKFNSTVIMFNPDKQKHSTEGDNFLGSLWCHDTNWHASNTVHVNFCQLIKFYYRQLLVDDMLVLLKSDPL